MKAILASLILTLAPLSAMAETPRETVIKALTALFINKDPAAVDMYWRPDYIQHNPMFPNGSDVLKSFVSGESSGFTYEMGMVIAEGDLVAVQGRYSGFGPKPMVAMDIFRVQDGKIAEHWDVLQEEVTPTVSGNPMFSPMQ
jgi:predicted SnoaL-like aldol condensation-catalyzing enzyme